MRNAPDTLKFIGVLIGVLTVIWGASWLWTADDRENNRHINKAIFPAFRAIENHCLNEQFPYETVRCEKVIELMERCRATENSCSADEYYDALFDAGFDMPPFYEPGYKPK